MAGASDIIDPIDAARDDIAGSKDLIASAVEDLSQHQRWIENYRVAETKHARRMKRQKLMLAVELITKHILRALRRFALLTARLARATWRVAASVSVRLARAVAAASVYAYALTRSAIAWTSPRVHALAVATGRQIAAAFAWTRHQVRMLVRATLDQAARAYAWGALRARARARAAYRTTEAGLSWLGAKPNVLARASIDAASTGFAWTTAKAHALSRATIKVTSAGVALAGVRGRQASIVASKQARRGAATAKRFGAHMKQSIFSRWPQWGRAEDLTSVAAEPTTVIAPPAEIGEAVIAVEAPSVLQTTTLTSHRPRRAKSRAIRASRRELRQAPRVAGRRTPAR